MRIFIFIILLIIVQVANGADSASGPYSMEKLIEQLEIKNTTGIAQRVNFDEVSTENSQSHAYLTDHVSKCIFDFGQDIGRSLLQLRPDNKFEVFSPVSIVAALNLVLLGAKGSTFEELSSVLKYSRNNILFQNPFKIHEEFSELLKEISSQSNNARPLLPWKETFFNPHVAEMYRNSYGSRPMDNGKISVANGIFVQQGYSIRDSYRNVAKSLYNCEIANLDFYGDPAAAAKFINGWVNQQTRGLVPKIVGDTVAPETRAIIANSLYFKADWYNEFLDGATEMRNFYPNGMLNAPVSVEMMGNAGRFPFYESPELDCRVLGLPYKQNQTTMYVILPNNSNKQKLIKLQNDLTGEKIENLISRMEVKTAIVLFPKMRLMSQSNLRDVLMGLGARSVFSPRMSDLSLMASPDNNENTSSGITSGRVTPGITSGRVERLSSYQTPDMSSRDSLHDQLIFTRVSDDDADTPKKRKRDVSYKVESDHAGSPLKFKDFILNKRISKSNPDKKKRRNRRNVPDPNTFLQELERLRYTTLRNPGLYADDVLHKVNLVVNEQGTEAAAATAVTINRSGPQVTFRVETPFLILIRHDDTKLPLFYGSVFEPVN